MHQNLISTRCWARSFSAASQPLLEPHHPRCGYDALRLEDDVGRDSTAVGVKDCRPKQPAKRKPVLRQVTQTEIAR
jgi:hypothetical protein